MNCNPRSSVLAIIQTGHSRYAEARTKDDVAETVKSELNLDVAVGTVFANVHLRILLKLLFISPLSFFFSPNTILIARHTIIRKENEELNYQIKMFHSFN